MLLTGTSRGVNFGYRDQKFQMKALKSVALIKG